MEFFRKYFKITFSSFNLSCCIWFVGGIPSPGKIKDLVQGLSWALVECVQGSRFRFHFHKHIFSTQLISCFPSVPCVSPASLYSLSPKEPGPWLFLSSRQDTQGCYRLNGGVETIGLANNCLSATASVFSVIIAFNTASYLHKRASGSSNFHWGLFRNAQAHHLVLILLACQNWS